MVIKSIADAAATENEPPPPDSNGLGAASVAAVVAGVFLLLLGLFSLRYVQVERQLRELRAAEDRDKSAISMAAEYDRRLAAGEFLESPPRHCPVCPYCERAFQWDVLKGSRKLEPVIQPVPFSK